MNGNSIEIMDLNLSSGLLPEEKILLWLLSGGCILNNET